MTPTTRFTVDVLLSADDRRAALLADARVGLTSSPKVLSPVWFYDERGSALFDEITRLPEYYLTRTERGLLSAHAAEIAAVTGADTLIELGSGTSEKTRMLLDATTAHGSLRSYTPLDVSEEILLESAATVAGEYPGLDVNAVVGDFHQHLGALPAGPSRLVAFLGSTIGNLTPAERRRFLFDLNCALGHDDWFLLGVDLVKESGVLLAAYDDSSGVTAEFNRNALRVVNRELDAHFDPEAFDHVAVWDPANEWIEMRLRARCDQTVAIGALETRISFEQGEEMRTEISAKFTPEGIGAELYEAGFVTRRTWQAGGDFLLVLSQPYC